MATRAHPLDETALEPALRSPEPRTAPRQPAHTRPPLRVVAPPSGRPGMAFVVLSALVVGALVLGLVVLNVLVAQTSFRVNDLQKAVQQEEARSQQLRYAVATADSPEALAEAAAGLGLVAPERQDFLVRPAGDPAAPAGPDTGSHAGPQPDNTDNNDKDADRNADKNKDGRE